MTNFLIYLSLLILVIVVFGTAAVAGFSAAPFVPTRRKDIKRLLKVAQIKEGDWLYDLGCGDGRLVIEAARSFGAKAVGIEMSVLPYLVSKLKVKFLGLGNKVQIKYGNFYQVSLKKADTIVCFLTPMAMKKLDKKLKKELKPGTRIVSYAFPLKNWQPLTVHKPKRGDVAVYLYQN